MTHILDMGPKLSLPIEAATSTFGVLGKTGSGKTNWAVVLCEELIVAGVQVVVLDPKGDWFGLRSSVDGKAEGYPIIILGGDHGDIPLEHTAGKVVAEWIVTDSPTVILDLSLFNKSQQRRFVEDFALELYRRNRLGMHLILDEADMFAPQQPRPGDQAMLGAIEDIVRRGRQRGIGVTFITQRPACLNKDVLTQSENLVAFRMLGPQDRDAIEAWIKFHGTKEERTEVLSSLSSLPVGCGWFWSPGWLEVLKKCQFRKRRTFDSSKTPTIGGVKMKPPIKLAPVDLQKLQGKIAETIERIRQDDPRALKARIAELEKELAQKTPVKAVPTIPPGLLSKLQDFEDSVREHLGTIEEIITLEPTEFDIEPPDRVKVPTTQVVRTATQVARKDADDRSYVGELKSLRPSESNLPKGELAVLTVIAQANGKATREMITVLTAYRRSTRDTYIQRLKERGFIDGLSPTKTGIVALGPEYTPLPTGKKLREYWLNNLPSGESTILSLLIDAYPKLLSRDELSSRTEFQRSTRDTYIQRLRAKLLVDGNVKASDQLF